MYQSYEVDRPLTISKNKIVMKLIKGNFCEKIKIALIPNMYSYLAGDDCVDKKSKRTKNCRIKQELKFED